MNDAQLNATLVRRVDLSEHLATFRFRVDSGAIAEFEPGQFVQIGLPHTEPAIDGRVRMHKRSYSIASSPLERDEVELYLTRVLAGRFTPLLWTLEPGARLWMDPVPKGIFTLGSVPATSELVLVATGTGLAPFVSMLRRWKGDERWSRAVVIHGARHLDELGYRGELEARQRDDRRVRYLPIVSRPRGRPEKGGWDGLVGHVQSVLEPARFLELTGARLDPTRCHVFLCGNPAMIVDVRKQLEPLEFRLNSVREPGNLHVEKYW